jgi:hypothetical protein
MSDATHLKDTIPMQSPASPYHEYVWGMGYVCPCMCCYMFRHDLNKFEAYERVVVQEGANFRVRLHPLTRAEAGK